MKRSGSLPQGGINVVLTVRLGGRLIMEEAEGKGDSVAPSVQSSATQQDAKEIEQKPIGRLRSMAISLGPKTRTRQRSLTKSERQMRQVLNQKRKMATEELSCIRPEQRRTTAKLSISAPIDMGFADKDKLTSTALSDGGTSHVDEKHALAEHLRSIAPFNKRWQVTETINEGTYGVVFAVRDVETGVRGVIKVAKSVGDDAGNQTAEWEAFILEKIYKQNPHASVVRLLDKGVLADQNGDAMQFMVLEKAEIGLLDYLNEFTGTERKLKVTQVSLQLLKGLYDMHREGLLHRDVKPDNMGILSREQPYVILFDLGMTRMYTDEVGQVVFHAHRVHSEALLSGRVDGRRKVESRIASMTSSDGFMSAANYSTRREFLYSHYRGPTDAAISILICRQILALLKTNHSAAYILLSRAPRQYYTINTYLTTANRNMVPDYRFIADNLREAVAELELQMQIEKKMSNDSIRKHAYILLSRAPRQYYTINTYLTTANRNMVPDYRFIADNLREAVAELELQMQIEKKMSNDSIRKHGDDAFPPSKEA
ncbi:Cell division control protein 2 -like protein D [Toxocara canis]|uniref:Cell division control protein 2-like protein D n=1 Tax=Toxocara canis TaxID=6265 RepID=A0A0B2VK31_TOXCA|nr:Cell division control protein 2 -like protein D [Toxocara canis]